MMTVMIILSVIFMLTALAPLLPGQHWLIRVWEFPRLQQAVILLTLLVVWSFWYYESPLLAMGMQLGCGLALAYHLIWILPYTPFWPKEVLMYKGSTSNENRISILTSNVLMPNKNYQALIDLVHRHQPDILVTLESNTDWEAALSVLHNDYPYRLSCPLDNLYGMHLYSKRSFNNQKIRFMVEDDVPSMEIWQDINGQKVKLHFVHPKPPSPTENQTAQPRDIELMVVGREMAMLDSPAIVTGDLNDVAWSPTTRDFRKISKMADPRRGRGFYNTFHADYSLLRWPLDHVFHSSHFELVDIKRMPSIGSDHFPLMTTLYLKPAQ